MEYAKWIHGSDGILEYNLEIRTLKKTNTGLEIEAPSYYLNFSGLMFLLGKMSTCYCIGGVL